MTAFQLYAENHFGEIGEVANIIDGSIYDPGIAISRPGFEMEGGVKKIVWIPKKSTKSSPARRSWKQW